MKRNAGEIIEEGGRWYYVRAVDSAGQVIDKEPLGTVLIKRLIASPKHLPGVTIHELLLQEGWRPPIESSEDEDQDLKHIVEAQDVKHIAEAELRRANG